MDAVIWFSLGFIAGGFLATLVVTLVIVNQFEKRSDEDDCY